MNNDHIVFARTYKGLHFICNNCSGMQLVELPLGLKELSEIGKEFIEKHQICVFHQTKKNN